MSETPTTPPGRPSRRANRLATQASPYLLQHAHNPVDWWPWGEEAFAEARRRDVPIFLSIGYSTCYWCHVMERESFENETVAAALAADYVAIKVDREERPDIDDIYMTATQLFTGHGGWPMSVFLEPDTLRPFWCGTYFPHPPREGIGVPGFIQVLAGLAEAWRTQRDDIRAQATELEQAVRAQLAPAAGAAASASASAPLSAEVITSAASTLLKLFDQNHGGFGRAPKFPQPANLHFLLEIRSRAASETQAALDRALRLTLDHMMLGGIHDHVGGGFHRYAVDSTWTVPHFEKMLYDNAQLALVYARASRVFSDTEYARAARRTLDYVLREMTVPAVGPLTAAAPSAPAGSSTSVPLAAPPVPVVPFLFASAQDAEVDHREGLNYLWTPEEAQATLGPADYKLAADLFGFSHAPNFQDPHHPADPPRHVLRLAARLSETAAQRGLAAADFMIQVDRLCTRLAAARATRRQANRDDKIIAAWNGLMIEALAAAAQYLEEPSYLAAAEAAASLLLRDMVNSRGELVRTQRHGRTSGPGFLEDYAFMAQGLLTLAEACAANPAAAARAAVYTASARALIRSARTQFRTADGSWFDTRADRPDLFVRTRTIHDGATPSGNSVMLHALLALHVRTGEAEVLTDALQLLASFASELAAHPAGHMNSARALFRLLSEPSFAPALRSHAAFASASSTAPASSREASVAPATSAKRSDFTPVEIYAAVERVTVGPDLPAEFTLVVRIADGYHLIAADPGVSTASLRPFRVEVHGSPNLHAYADYPTGTPLAHADLAPELSDVRVYTGSIEFSVALEATGPVSGRPLLRVTFQACGPAACLPPTTVELDVAIDA